MKKLFSAAFRLLALFLLLPFMGSCNQEDDVMAIFAGKEWKLTYIAAEGSHKQFDFWNGNDQSREKSMAELKKSDTFVLTFSGTDLADITGGDFNGHAVKSDISGTWTANGETKVLSLGGVKTTQTESDVLANAFITGVRNAFRYDGDDQNLYIYYKENNRVKFMSFRPNK